MIYKLIPDWYNLKSSRETSNRKNQNIRLKQTFKILQPNTFWVSLIDFGHLANIYVLFVHYRTT